MKKGVYLFLIFLLSYIFFIVFSLPYSLFWVCLAFSVPTFSLPLFSLSVVVFCLLSLPSFLFLLSIPLLLSFYFPSSFLLFSFSSVPYFYYHYYHYSFEYVLPTSSLFLFFYHFFLHPFPFHSPLSFPSPSSPLPPFFLPPFPPSSLTPFSILPSFGLIINSYPRRSSIQNLYIYWCLVRHHSYRLGFFCTSEKWKYKLYCDVCLGCEEYIRNQAFLIYSIFICRFSFSCT